MLKLNLKFPFLIGIGLLTYHNSLAFDPVTIAMAAQSANTMLKGMDRVDEAADVGFALTELLEELGIESETEKDIDSAVSKLGSLNSKAKEMQWAQEEFKNSLNQDLQRGKSLTAKIKAMKKTLQASKKIATLMGFRPKAGEKAVHIQEIKLNSMILEELQSMRQGMFLAHLEDKEARVKREIYLQEILEKEKYPNLKVPRQ